MLSYAHNSMTSFPPPGLPLGAPPAPPAQSWGEAPPVQWIAPDDQSTFVPVPLIEPQPRRAWLGGDPLGGSEPGRAGMASAVGRRRLAFVLSGALLVGAGVALVAASFATWVHADLLGVGLRDGSGWNNVAGHLSFGPGVAAAGIAVIFMSIAALLDRRSRAALVLVLVALMAALALAVVQVIDLNRTVTGVESHVGIGIWMMSVSIVVGLIVWPVAFVLAGRAKAPGVAAPNPVAHGRATFAPS